MVISKSLFIVQGKQKEKVGGCEREMEKERRDGCVCEGMQ